MQGKGGPNVSTHSPGAMRAAMAIVNARSSISTAHGDKTTGELADFIEHETRIVELTDAVQRLLQAIDDTSAPPGEATSIEPAVAQHLDELRQTLRSAIDRPVTDAPAYRRGH